MLKNKRFVITSLLLSLQLLTACSQQQVVGGAVAVAKLPVKAAGAAAGAAGSVVGGTVGGVVGGNIGRRIGSAAGGSIGRAAVPDL